MKFFRDEYVPLKRQGVRVKIRRKSWLKQLRVAISTRASVPSKSSPQNSQANFVNLHHVVCDVKTRKNFSKKYRQSKHLHSTRISLTCLEIFMQNGKVGEGDVFSKKMLLLP
jgi:hypothetical protein